MKTGPSIPGRKLPNALPRLSWITLALGAARPARAQPTDLPGSSPPAAEEWRVVERGQDFAVFQRFRARTQADGSLRWQPGGRYTLLENGLHYRDPVSGQWQESRDLIERFPDGAIARYGPLRAIFSHDLNTESVFDLETPAGARLRGGLRALEWLDEATGQRQLLAGVKPSAPLELVPPNWLVARDAFDGVAADVVLEWRHDRFSQNVVLRELPWPPEGFAPGTTRLVVVTEFLETPEPVLQRVTVPGAGGQAVSDDVGIHFDGASILQGHAFAVRAGSEWALQVGAGGAPGEAVEVRKVWTSDGAGGAVLEESVAWEALARLAADQLTGNVGVSWYDCRNNPNNRRVHFFAAVSRDGFASTTPPRNFQLNPTDSLATSVDWAHYYDYSGLAFYRGWLYPVWGDLSNRTGDNPDGTSKPDILVCPLPF
jgi:hypothetical protein